MQRWWIFVAALALLPGCGTVSSWASGCRGVYSGVRQDAELLAAYQQPPAIESEVPLGVDAWLARSWDTATLAIDVPISAVADALSAPIVLAAGPTTPEPPGLGCGWSATPQREESPAAGAPGAAQQEP